MSDPNCHCSCGKAAFRVNGPALFRCYCHCTICQRFNEAAYADIIVFRASDVEAPRDGLVEYKGYKKVPPVVQRGYLRSQLTFTRKLLSSLRNR